MPRPSGLYIRDESAITFVFIVHHKPTRTFLKEIQINVTVTSYYDYFTSV